MPSLQSQEYVQLSTISRVSVTCWKTQCCVILRYWLIVKNPNSEGSLESTASGRRRWVKQLSLDSECLCRKFWGISVSDYWKLQVSTDWAERSSPPRWWLPFKECRFELVWPSCSPGLTTKDFYVFPELSGRYFDSGDDIIGTTFWEVQEEVIHIVFDGV